MRFQARQLRRVGAAPRDLVQEVDQLRRTGTPASSSPHCSTDR